MASESSVLNCQVCFLFFIFFNRVKSLQNVPNEHNVEVPWHMNLQIYRHVPIETRP